MFPNKLTLTGDDNSNQCCSSNTVCNFKSSHFFNLLKYKLSNTVCNFKSSHFFNLLKYKLSNTVCNFKSSNFFNLLKYKLSNTVCNFKSSKFFNLLKYKFCSVSCFFFFFSTMSQNYMYVIFPRFSRFLGKSPDPWNTFVFLSKQALLE